MPVLSNPKWEKFATNLASGLSAAESYVKAGYSATGARGAASRLLANVIVSQRVAELSEQITEKTVKVAIADRQARIEMYGEINRRLWLIVDERAAAPEMEKIPGGKGGFVVRQVKAVGGGARQKIILEYVADTPLARAILANAEQLAKDSGDWTEKRQITGKDGGPVSVELFDAWLEEADAAADAVKEEKHGSAADPVQ